jgi:hypothetical protein
MLKSSRLKPLIIILFMGVIMASLLFSITITPNNVSASDNSKVQHFTAVLRDRSIISTKDGYPVYDVIFVKQDGTVFDYYGGSIWVNTIYNHMHSNALDIYTKGQLDRSYEIDMDASDNIVNIKGEGF